MVLEAATLSITAGREAQFEDALRNASPIISAAKGYISHELEKCHETEGKYLLLVRWNTLEDHLVGFRQSAAFQEWRRIIQPFYQSPAAVEHFTRIELNTNSD
ncbi:MAG: antibiotic biosynthesis monooxygenase family protein [Terriglobia bacterium]